MLIQDLQIAAPPSRWPVTWPMALTVLRLLLLPIFLWLIWPWAVFQNISDDQRRWLAVSVFLVMCVTDILDGYLARRLHQTSRLGTLLDPTADKLLVETSLLLLCIGSKALGGFVIPWPVVLGAYLKDLGVLIGIGVVIRRNHTVKLAAQVAGKTCTAMQLTFVIVTLLAVDIARWSPAMAGGLLWTLWWVTVWATAASGWAYSYAGWVQLREAAAVAG